MVVIMHDGADPALSKFQPWLFALTTVLPRLTIGQIDVSDQGRDIGASFKVSGSTAIKMFLRDNPKGKRIVDYQGPLEFDALLGWCNAGIAGEEHAYSAPGHEPPENAANPEGARGTNKMDKLPPSVRAMAETMVREQRLQRLLKERGDGMFQKYEDLVSSQYRGIIDEEKTDLNDKYAAQEANRRARDIVRNELLLSAPADIREEIEGEVHLGDAAKAIG